MLYVLVEGDDDARFFERIVRPICEKDYDYVLFWQYSQQRKEKVNSFLGSIRTMQATGVADLIIVADLDESPCVTDRKERVLSGFRNLISDAGGFSGPISFPEILIVCREIEGWYLAGLDENEYERLGILENLKDTDRVSKEQFLGLMPERFDSKTEFMLAILDVFDYETARSRNRSFRYFMQKRESDSNRA